jgi:hypothetical protein
MVPAECPSSAARRRASGANSRAPSRTRRGRTSALLNLLRWLAQVNSGPKIEPLVARSSAATMEPSRGPPSISESPSSLELESPCFWLRPIRRGSGRLLHGSPLRVRCTIWPKGLLSSGTFLYGTGRKFECLASAAVRASSRPRPRSANQPGLFLPRSGSTPVLPDEPTGYPDFQYPQRSRRRTCRRHHAGVSTAP